jgi:hypothetical protein
MGLTGLCILIRAFKEGGKGFLDEVSQLFCGDNQIAVFQGVDDFFWYLSVGSFGSLWKLLLSRK